MDFFVGPFLGFGTVGLLDWNSVMDSLIKYQRVVTLNRADKVGGIPLYGLNLGVGFPNGVLVGLEIQPYQVNRSVEWEYRYNEELFKAQANLRGFFITPYVGLGKDFGPLGVYLMGRLIFGTSRIDYLSESISPHDKIVKIELKGKAPNSTGGGFALWVNYDIYPWLELGLQMGYEYITFTSYKGTLTSTLIYQDQESSYTDTTEYYWSAYGLSYDYPLPIGYPSVEDFQGARVRFYLSFRIGG